MKSSGGFFRSDRIKGATAENYPPSGENNRYQVRQQTSLTLPLSSNRHEHLHQYPHIDMFNWPHVSCQIQLHQHAGFSFTGPPVLPLELTSSTLDEQANVPFIPKPVVAIPRNVSLLERHSSHNRVVEHEISNLQKASLLGCEDCSEDAEVSHDVRNHFENLLSTRPFECYICWQKFKQKKHMKRHMSIHSAEKKFRCDICSKQFRRKDNMSSHRKIHAAKTNLCCKICQISFRNQGAYISHYKIHDDVL